MKRLLILAALAASPALAQSSQYVQGHMNADGTYTQGYYRSAPDNTTLNNYSTQGNVNPYTGQAGTVPYQPYQPYKAPEPPKQTHQSGYPH